MSHRRLHRLRHAHKVEAPAPATVNRISSIDALRGFAICLMIAYHFCFDLNLPWVDVIHADFNHDLFWLTARSIIVSTFLTLVGISLVLARHGDASPRHFWRRIALIAGCAILVTAGSYVLYPQTFIVFGILHCIAIASLLGQPLVAQPRAALGIGLAIVVAGVAVKLPLFDTPWLNWIGMMTHKPTTEDYVPLFPWLGVVFIGIWLGAMLSDRQFRPLRAVARNAPAWLRFLGRHSLLVYMIHQPLLLAALWLVVGGSL
jgi:uncharacterized membrane protein